MESYSVRCIFLWERRPDQTAAHIYEERITLWRAENAESALQFAEQEARQYARDNGIEFLDEYFVSYELVDTVDAHGVEVFSLLRESDLDRSAYVNAFFDTGTERQQDG